MAHGSDIGMKTPLLAAAYLARKDQGDSRTELQTATAHFVSSDVLFHCLGEEELERPIQVQDLDRFSNGPAVHGSSGL